MPYSSSWIKRVTLNAFILSPQLKAPTSLEPLKTMLQVMILRWQQEGNDEVVLAIANDLKNLGLTKWVKAKPVDDSSVELKCWPNACAA